MPQIIAASTRGSHPSLVVDGGEAVSLEGQFSWQIEGPTRCTGKWENGSHIPCPNQTPVQNFRQCGLCMELEDPACVFEPKCGGDPESCHCFTSFRGVPHVVYIAWYGLLPKVGMTSATRLYSRLQEQGADAGFVAANQLPNGQELTRGDARRLEVEIGKLWKIPEFRPTRVTSRSLHRPIPWDTLMERAQTLASAIGKHYQGNHELIRIIDHAMPEPLPAPPQPVTAEGKIAGTWLGGKGGQLFFEPKGGVTLDVGGRRAASLRLGELVGKQVAF